jgi:hypothetical protein
MSTKEEYSKMWLSLNKIKINLYRMTLGETDKEILKLVEARSKIEEVLRYLETKIDKK